MLSGNMLTGPIPWTLASLPKLQALNLSENDLTGCVPPALRSVEDNDLDDLGLTDCTEEGPAPAPEGLSVSLTDVTFTFTRTSAAGAARYEIRYRVGGSDEEWESVAISEGTSATFVPDGGPRVRYDVRIQREVLRGRRDVCGRLGPGLRRGVRSDERLQSIGTRMLTTPTRPTQFRKGSSRLLGTTPARNRLPLPTGATTPACR